MKNLLKLSSLALMLVLVMTACDTDPADPVDTRPSIELVDEAGFIAFDSDLTPGETFKVKVSAVSGTNPLNSLEVLADGARATNVVDINGNPNNPAAVVADDDKNSFVWTVTLTAQNEGTVNYEFVASDNMQLTDAVSLNINAGAGEPASLSVTGDGMFMVSPASLVSVEVTGTVGSSPLSTIGVQEEGVDITNLSRLRINDATNEFTSNPQALEEGQKQGFTTNLYIRSHEGSGSKTYTIVLADEAGNTTSQDITISSGTPVTESTLVVVNNADGPFQGGLDLDARTSVSSSSADAEIRDRGIDSALPASQNWLQSIEAVNGAVLRTVNASQPETFNYANINSVEAIQNAFDAGTTVDYTDAIEVGDVFMVSANGSYWILQVATVEIKDANNEDFYEFNIKG